VQIGRAQDAFIKLSLLRQHAGLPMPLKGKNKGKDVDKDGHKKNEDPRAWIGQIHPVCIPWHCVSDSNYSSVWQELQELAHRWEDQHADAVVQAVAWIVSPEARALQVGMRPRALLNILSVIQ
jgi:hypothetical protein